MARIGFSQMGIPAGKQAWPTAGAQQMEEGQAGTADAVLLYG